MNWRPKGKKAQSAMEYLMTYGWAILIIAVVLGALFSLGVFSSSSFLGTACIPQSGYMCSNPIFQHGVGLKLTLGQATGTSWTSATFCVIPTGASLPSSGCGKYAANTSSTGLNSGQTVTLLFTNDTLASLTSYPIGAGFSGQVWAYYSTSTSSNLMTEIGTVTAKVS
ncbi:MAG: hypothetical protein ACP5GD_01845 [Candidatus Micrarchaeia archaeon]